MAEAFINVTEGSGKKLHTYDRSIGGNTVHDEIVLLGESYIPSFSAAPAAQSAATTNSHLLQLMAGANKNLYIKKIRVDQSTALAAAVNTVAIHIIRLTTAGTGGGSVTPLAFDAATTADATAMTLPTSKGTEASNPILRATLGLRASNPVLASDGWEWYAHNRQQAIKIPAGTSNGIAIKLSGSDASASIVVRFEFDETTL